MLIDVEKFKTATLSFDVKFADPLPINGDEEVRNYTFVDVAGDEFTPEDSCDDSYTNCTDYPFGDDDTLNNKSPDLTIDKKVYDASQDNIASSDETLTYQITVTNESQIAALDVVITDEMEMLEALGATYDPNVTVSVGEESYSGNLNDGITIDQIGNQPAIIEFDATMPKDVNALNYLYNEANVSYDDGDTATEKVIKEDHATINTGDIGALSVRKDVTDASKDSIAQENEMLTYEINVTNTSFNTVYDITVKDELLDPILSQYADDVNVDVMVDDQVVSSGNLKQGVTIESLVPSATATIKFDVELKELPNNIVIENTVNVEAKNAPTVQAQEVITTNVPDTDISFLHVDKKVIDEDGDFTAEKSEELTYKFLITNDSEVDALNVVLKDKLDDKYLSTLNIDTNVDVKIDEQIISGDIKQGIVIPVLPAGKSATAELKVTLDNNVVESSKITNEVFVSSDNTPLVSDVETIGTFTKGLTGSLDIEKTVEDENKNNLAEVGEKLSYNIAVNNTSNGVLTNVVIKDQLTDPYLSTLNIDPNVDVLVNDNVIASGDITNGITLETLNPHETAVIKFDVEMDEKLISDTQISNTATASADDINPAEDTAIITTFADDENIIEDPNGEDPEDPSGEDPEDPSSENPGTSDNGTGSGSNSDGTQIDDGKEQNNKNNDNSSMFGKVIATGSSLYTILILGLSATLIYLISLKCRK
jgi:uncharacterized repeat protein (TIGR01451 family)